jgi:hypothetical protein
VNFFYLAFQFLGCGWALGFVFLEHFMSEGRCGTVKGHSPVSGLKISKYLEQRTGKAIDGIYQLPGLGLSQRGQGVKGTVHQGIAIEKLIILWRHRNPKQSR